jgi:hypothetical protein
MFKRNFRVNFLKINNWTGFYGAVITMSTGPPAQDQ